MTKDIITKVGFVLLILGVSAADSEKLIIPFAMMLVGALMLLIGASDYDSEGEKWQK